VVLFGMQNARNSPWSSPIFKQRAQKHRVLSLPLRLWLFGMKIDGIALGDHAVRQVGGSLGWWQPRFLVAVTIGG